MIRGYDTHNGGLVLFTPLSRRRRAARRRWVTLAIVATLAATGALVGQLSAGRDIASPPTPAGPLSYLPQ